MAPAAPEPTAVTATVALLPENLKGRVVDRNLMFTTLREHDGAVLQVPNSLFFQKVFRVSGETGESLFEYLERQRMSGAPLGPPTPPAPLNGPRD